MTSEISLTGFSAVRRCSVLFYSWGLGGAAPLALVDGLKWSFWKWNQNLLVYLRFPLTRYIVLDRHISSRTISDDPRTILDDPGQSWTIPGRSRTIPDDPRTILDDPRTIPGRSRTMPDDPRTIPDDPRTIPGRSRTIRTISDDIFGRGGTSLEFVGKLYRNDLSPLIRIL
jgi:hypothetical protein